MFDEFSGAAAGPIGDPTESCKVKQRPQDKDVLSLPLLTLLGPQLRQEPALYPLGLC